MSKRQSSVQSFRKSRRCSVMPLNALEADNTISSSISPPPRNTQPFLSLTDTAAPRRDPADALAPRAIHAAAHTAGAASPTCTPRLIRVVWMQAIRPCKQVQYICKTDDAANSTRQTRSDYRRG
jgi:hypothetical protein